ncbi:MAG: hypothetical protein IJT15_02185, partial [Rickettsiales bacterium]|nr:hypothetical protein [Rickettsiales bacterium]
MEDNQEPEQQNYDFTDDQRAEILKETFNVGPHMNECEEKSLENIIDSVIKAIKDDDYYNVIKCCIKKYWFTKQIEEWKYKENTKEAPEDDELMNIVKEDLKIRIANTMLELKKHNIDEKNIWFYQNGEYVDVKHNDDKICQVSEFNTVYRHVSPPYKPCFMNDKNDKNKLNGVCIYKHGKDENEDGKSKTKWIMACFKDDDTEPQCKITFKTDENDKITNVEIETAKDRNGDKSIYTISL